MKAFMNLPIAKKLIFLFLFVGLVPMTIIATKAVVNANDTITSQAFNQLSAVRSLKGKEIERYFQRVRNQVETLSADPNIVDSASRLRSGFRLYRNQTRASEAQIASRKEGMINYYQNAFGKQYESINGTATNTRDMYMNLDADSWALQHAYISGNPHPLGSKDKLDFSDDGSDYSQAHRDVHPKLRNFLHKFGYYDIFIADPRSGDIVYSVFKELDFSTSLIDGPYANTSIGEAFKKAMQLEDKSASTLVDFRTYKPSYDAPASFVASPIHKRGRVVGILIFQLPIEDINTIMTERVGMGDTGETYLVGSDKLMRSDSYLEAEFHNVVASFKNPEKGSVDTDAVDRAFAGEDGADIIIDYNGNPVLSSYGVVDLGEFNWAVIAEQDVAEAFASVSALKSLIFAVGLICALAVFGLAYWVSQLIATPIKRVSELLKVTANSGKFDNKVGLDTSDEVGQMGRSFDELMDALAGMFAETNTVLNSVSQGDYDVSIKGNYHGDVEVLSSGVNRAIERILAAQNAQKEQQKVVEQAAEETAQKAQEAEQAATEASAAADEANRVRRALDVASTGVMMIDDNHNIVYVNDALQTMMSNAEADIRGSVSQFSAHQLVGMSMNAFQSQSDEQIISTANVPNELQLTLGSRIFRLNGNPILRDGDRIGTVVEWVDRTEEIAIENDVDAMVEAAARGDLSKRLEVESDNAFFNSLADGLNRLVDTTSKVVDEVNSVIGAMAGGDLRQKVESSYEGTFGELKTNINSTMEKLEDVVSDISEAANQVSMSASEINQGMGDLSERTEQQASSLEETASTMTQMTETVNSSAKSAKSANELARNAEAKAAEGGEAVRNAIGAMASISEASNKIADIIGVIDEIAFQTNLLALNAAVEAARAGEQGRGFAVVASEVRQLAQRSSNAAKEIKDLINDSVDRVQHGSELVNGAGDTLSDIVAAVENVGAMISDIASAASEQASGISQVNIAINRIDEGTQQNSALVEETHAAGDVIAGQARAMADAMGFFRAR